ncbi:uncharacterized protein EV420DRAFT_1623280 [Desarmillaria tabescens]|uniref:Uncharacterized protein n=1 Tax=Armillaria tabescens TaxID=1929756 RepID=A0AA39ML65_ARMTA|nr:uncharacterized protein EV420DRAFT_1623280 [Desarmillaria tabescens]KAK0438332.1 hypothetical protein EV420DRAFT_1623280 [Desarmillaria tabescens]
MLTVLIVLAPLALALQLPIQPGSVDFYDPNLNGGSMLDNAGGGLGEPLNVIISGKSSPEVLTNDGIVITHGRLDCISEECLGIHIGDPQSANLGDGHGWVNQTMELREDYGNEELGTCLETIIGGNHFRVYRQDGPDAMSGALFLARKQHTIVPDGYNIGRDQLVQHAVGNHHFDGVHYTTTAKNITGLLPAGIATDGITTLLTVQTTR